MQVEQEQSIWTQGSILWELHDDMIMCVCREGGENESDIMTKNPASAEFEKHSPKMSCEVPQELLEKVKKEEGC